LEDVDNLKLTVTGPPKYRLRTGNLHVGVEGFHLLDVLDSTETISPHVDSEKLTPEIATYIEGELQSNPTRFERQVALVARHLQGGSLVSTSDAVAASSCRCFAVEDFGSRGQI
jgi:hypothetical protein